MNINIYTNPDGGLEFTGTRFDGQIINGSLDKTMTVEQLKERVENTKTAKELEQEERQLEDMNIKLALAEIFEMILPLTMPEEELPIEEPPLEPTSE